MTIPAIMQSTQNQETVAKVKKFYSTASQAYERAVADNGPVDGWGWIAYDSPQGVQNVLNILAPYLNVTKNCGTSSGCLPNVTDTFLNGTSDINYNASSRYAKAQLADGSFLWILSRSTNCTNVRGTSLALQNICGWIQVDINGFNGPNQWSKDVFGFYITKYGVVPAGTSEETTYPPSSCDKAASGNAGIACTTWVLQKGNMDYLN